MGGRKKACQSRWERRVKGGMREENKKEQRSGERTGPGEGLGGRGR